MTKALDLRENQVRAILRAARKEGVRIEVKIGDAVVTAIPDDRPQDDGQVDNPEPPDSLEEYLARRDRNRAREDQGHS